MKNHSRRSFLKASALAATAMAATRAASNPRVHAGEDNMLKLGIVGCGGRGCGAVGNALTADPNVKLVIAADVVEGRARAQLDALKEQFGERVDVNDSLFIGFDAYKKVLESDVDIVLLTIGLNQIHKLLGIRLFDLSLSHALYILQFLKGDGVIGSHLIDRHILEDDVWRTSQLF